MIYLLRTGTQMNSDYEYMEALAKKIYECGKPFDEVWLATSYALPTLEKCRELTEDIKKCADIFRKYGIIPSIQVSRTIGHAPVKIDMGGVDTEKVNYMRSVDGGLSKGRICYNDPILRDYVYEAMKIYAEAKPYIAWVDDDLRLRKPAAGGRSLCFCDACLEKYNRLYNKNYTLVSIREPFINDVNVRKEYIDFQNKSLGELAGIISKAFKEVSPETIVSLQTGADITLATDANKTCLDVMYDTMGNVPAVRAGGGFYNDHDPQLMINKAFKINYAVSRLPEYVKMIASEIENLPFIAYAKSDDGICIESALYCAYGCNMASITLMRDYESIDSYYAKQFEKLAEYKPYLDKTTKHNDGSKNGGVVIYQAEKAALRTGEEAATIWDRSYIYDAAKIARLGIPFHCGTKGTAYLVTQNSVHSMTPEDIEDMLKKPVITDGSTIETLINKGYGEKLGITARPVDEKYRNGITQTMTDHKINDGFSLGVWVDSYFACKDTQYVFEGENIEKLMECHTPEYLGGEHLGCGSAIFTTCYGARWAVKGANLLSGSLSSDMRTQMLRMIEYISEEKLPAYLNTAAQAMVIPRVKDDKTVSVAILNVSINDYDDVEVVINNPANEKECTLVYPYEEDKKFPLVKKGDSFSVTLPKLERWRIKTILL